MPVARCGDSQVYYEDTGGDGPVIVLAHGYAMDHTMFEGVTRLSPEWRVIRWDARGHGRTRDGGQAFTYWDLAGDLLGLLDHLGVETASVGGVSQGGFISLRAALMAPDRVASLLLFDTEAGACSPEDRAAYSELFGMLADQGPREDLVTSLAAQIVGDHPEAGDWARRWGRTGLPLGTPTECLLGRDDIIDRLPTIRQPALLARGEHDLSIPVQRMNILHERLAGSTDIQVIPGAGHSPPVTHPDETNAVLVQFLAEQSRAA
jgi:pimeloyl-ACP methyl ester carboxylesterase